MAPVSLVVLEHVNLSYGPRAILHDASIRIAAGDRIGLIGPNGSGKSTLLRVILGRQAPDSGVVRTSRGCRIGWLPQDVQELGGDTLLGSVLATVPGRTAVEERLSEAEVELAVAADAVEQLALAQEIAELGERLGHFEVYFSERRAIRILLGLGFARTELERPTTELSGGWKMRAALAGLLFQEPDVLLLDEPTNHLDLPSVLWLDGFLRERRAATILICHDRDFLNRHIDRVLTFEPEGLRTYTGDYDAYLALRSTEEEVLDARQRNRERELKEMERFVERFKAKASKARQAQSRAKRARRLQAELSENAPPGARRTLRFRFPEVARCGRDVALIEGLSKSFGALHLYRGLNQRIDAGDRIGIVGRNGAGKTTLLRMLASELRPDAGTIRLGTGVDIGYYAQHHDDLLTPSWTVVEEVRAASGGGSESFVRGVCGAFLFSGDDVDKRIAVLSGGERARVLLARLLVRPGNLLLMDEPTNHLDLDAADALAEALETYGGTLVFVSHNTAFTRRLATRIWDIDGGDLHDYPGTLDEYLDSQQRRSEPGADAPAPPAPKRRARAPRPVAAPAPAPKRAGPSGPAKPLVPPPSARAAATPDRAPVRRRRRERPNRDDDRPAEPPELIERRIAELTEELALLSEDLADPASFEAAWPKYRAAQAKLEELQGRLAATR